MWILPTRGRPEACDELIRAFRNTCTDAKVAVVIDDDPSKYKDVDWPDNWDIHNPEEHLELVGAVNYAVDKYPGAKFYGMIGDYARPRTIGWDERLVRAAGKWNVAYCKDNWMHGRNQKDWRRPHISGALCVGGDLVRKLGWMFYPELVHLYVDDVLEVIATETDAHRYLDGVLVEVDRPETTGKEQDDNHKRIYKGASYPQSDKKAFLNWVNSDMGMAVYGINKAKWSYVEDRCLE